MARCSKLQRAIFRLLFRKQSPAYARAVAEFGKQDVASITSRDIERYINQFAKTYAKKTVAAQRQSIRQILKRAQFEGYIAYNPAHLRDGCNSVRRRYHVGAVTHGTRDRFVHARCLRAHQRDHDAGHGEPDAALLHKPFKAWPDACFSRLKRTLFHL